MPFFRESVRFTDARGGGDFIKGLDVTGPPARPMHFLINPGGKGDIIIDSSDDGSDLEENALNIATIGEPKNNE